MQQKNYVFIATSLDGYIADKDGGLEWLHMVPNPQQMDLGYTKFIAQIDALVMGRSTFETVCGFDGDWPYTKPVFVLSRTLKSLPAEYQRIAEVVNGSLTEVLNTIHRKGYSNLYVDGGATVQSFLEEDLIDELIISTVPVLLGGGVSLFGKLEKFLEFELVRSETFLDAITQVTYRRKKRYRTRK